MLLFIAVKALPNNQYVVYCVVTRSYFTVSLDNLALPLAIGDEWLAEASLKRSDEILLRHTTTDLSVSFWRQDFSESLRNLRLSCEVMSAYDK